MELERGGYSAIKDTKLKILVSARVVDEPAAERNSASRPDHVAPGLLLAPLSQPLSRKNTP